jgi:membrane protein DedA with SNARE-associated domain
VLAALLFYVGMGLLLTLEEAGVFLLPGDISLIAAGVNSSHGGANLFVTWIVASTSMVLGASILFRTLSRSDHMSRVVPERAVQLIHNHHVYGIALARLLPGLRNATVLAAAGAKLPFRTFLLGLIPAAFIWSGFLLVLGWFGGSTMLDAYSRLHDSRLLQVCSLGLLAGIALFVFIRLRSTRRLVEEREGR